MTNSARVGEGVDLLVERCGATAVISFDRPGARNALNRRTRTALVAILERLDADPDVRVVVLTGSDPAFSSGVDIKELLSDEAYEAPLTDPATCLRALSVPVIAAVNGACVSGALEIVLACSFVLASDRASFADTHAVLGLTPGWGLSAELPAAVGTARARQMTLTGRPVDAPTALAWGLVNEVVPHERLPDRVREVAEEIAGAPRAAIANAVRLYREGHEERLTAARQREARVLRGWGLEKGDARHRFSTRRAASLRDGGLY
ncbi:enoyl-CoA hydratase-related protein [Microbacterium sp. zg-YB36]|uniref:enoyl-CoA hydratase-related protein n=1 Tax=Microbacterium sp. zg-YB36 TaxID=2969407 RepID=UPI00214BCEBC|nr:enoyl-CoA hydratase-related protein [Microbacterium sp. zg-YB36]MDL5351805.1 enoyl-CoA hydratase-related protein [Microbacterium sp. zg-YB36]